MSNLPRGVQNVRRGGAVGLSPRSREGELRAELLEAKDWIVTLSEKVDVMQVNMAKILARTVTRVLEECEFQLEDAWYDWQEIAYERRRARKVVQRCVQRLTHAEVSQAFHGWASIARTAVREKLKMQNRSLTGLDPEAVMGGQGYRRRSGSLGGDLSQLAAITAAAQGDRDRKRNRRTSIAGRGGSKRVEELTGELNRLNQRSMEQQQTIRSLKKELQGLKDNKPKAGSQDRIEKSLTHIKNKLSKLDKQDFSLKKRRRAASDMQGSHRRPSVEGRTKSVGLPDSAPVAEREVSIGAPVDENEAPPPVGLVTLVFTDIQDSTTLWDTDAAMMEATLDEHNRICREMIRQFSGYEVKTEGDAFVIAFASPLLATNWCLHTQMELLKGLWPEKLYELPSGAVVHKNNSLIYRGVRVRMSVHCGKPLCRADPITGRYDYFGPVVNAAARLGGIAKGGQVLISSSVMDLIEDEAKNNFLVHPLGEHKFRGITKHMGVFEVKAPSLQLRIFPPVSRPAELEPPTGNVTLVYSDVPGIGDMFDEAPKMARAGLQAHDEFITRMARKHRGYIVRSAAGACIVAFQSCELALRYCMSVQEGMLQLSWPALMDSYESCKVVHSDSGEILFRGLRVVMGCVSGSPECVYNELAGRMHYAGQCADQAYLLSRMGQPGQILAEDRTVNLVLDELDVEPFIVDMGTHHLQRADIHILQVMPESLSQRQFNQLKDVSEIDRAVANLKDENDMLYNQLAQMREELGDAVVSLSDVETNVKKFTSEVVDELTRDGLYDPKGIPELQRSNSSSSMVKSRRPSLKQPYIYSSKDPSRASSPVDVVSSIDNAFSNLGSRPVTPDNDLVRYDPREDKDGASKAITAAPPPTVYPETCDYCGSCFAQAMMAKSIAKDVTAIRTYMEKRSQRRGSQTDLLENSQALMTLLEEIVSKLTTSADEFKKRAEQLRVMAPEPEASGASLGQDTLPLPAPKPAVPPPPKANAHPPEARSKVNRPPSPLRRRTQTPTDKIPLAATQSRDFKPQRARLPHAHSQPKLTRYGEYVRPHSSVHSPRGNLIVRGHISTGLLSTSTVDDFPSVPHLNLQTIDRLPPTGDGADVPILMAPPAGRLSHNLRWSTGLAPMNNGAATARPGNLSNSSPAAPLGSSGAQTSRGPLMVNGRG